MTAHRPPVVSHSPPAAAAAGHAAAPLLITMPGGWRVNPRWIIALGAMRNDRDDMPWTRAPGGHVYEAVVLLETPARVNRVLCVTLAGARELRDKTAETANAVAAAEGVPAIAIAKPAPHGVRLGRRLIQMRNGWWVDPVWITETTAKPDKYSGEPRPDGKQPYGAAVEIQTPHKRNKVPQRTLAEAEELSDWLGAYANAQADAREAALAAAAGEAAGNPAPATDGGSAA